MDLADCPSADTLHAFIIGKLDDGVLDEVASHVETCANCQAMLDTLSARQDSLVGRLHAATGDDPYANETECRRAIDWAAKIAASPDATGLTAPAKPAGPRRLGDYEILAKLGQGGMGVVYKARHVLLDKMVAVKVLPKWRLSDPNAGARFGREMTTMGRLLNHENIVQATDARDVEGTLVLVMELVDGHDLAKLVERWGPLPIADACEIVRQTAAGLQSIHANKQVHRDIKPSNLMLTLAVRSPEGQAGTEGLVKILDLGLAMLREGSSSMTDSGSILGTADYMAPEQAADARRVDIRADIYSLGCTMYKLLTGHAPFSGPEYPNEMAKMVGHLQTPVPPVHQLRVDVPEGLAAVLDRMMAKDPADRFATPAEVAKAVAPFCPGSNLPRLLSETPPQVPVAVDSLSETIPNRRTLPGGRSPLALERLVRHRGLVLAVAVVLVAAAIGAAVWVFRSVFQHPTVASRRPTDASQPDPVDTQIPPVAVREATLFVRRGGDDNAMERLTLSGSHNESERTFKPLGPNDDFKLNVEFDRPTYWYVVWLDTKGVVEVAAHAQQPEKIVEYPGGNHLVSVDPSDPAGVHLILVLASDLPPDKIETQLRHRLVGVGPPSTVLGMNQPLGVTRGAGSIQSTTANLDPHYFQRVEERLPAGVHWVQQVYLPTEKRSR
jgi:serine/threonine protein kinase